ncbi:MAG TPA: hypothetical protein VHP37_17770 [Burkholderiales bacterium]|nr:hypothetical protein [Burkholderiales bacterium]
MRFLAVIVLGLVLAAPAFANPALHGTWSAAVDGQPLTVTFEPNGTGTVNGKPMKWQTLMRLLLVQQQGADVVSYSFDARPDSLTVSGGDLPGIVTMTRGTAAAEAAAKMAKATPQASAQGSSGGGGQDLVGRWCKGSNFTANSGGGSSRMTCIDLRADGTYTYQSQGSMSANAPGMWGGTSSQSADSGRWSVAGNRITAQSRSGQTNSYTLEKRNNPKNRRDPMICLDGDCYTTYYNRPPW